MKNFIACTGYCLNEVKSSQMKTSILSLTNFNSLNENYSILNDAYTGFNRKENNLAGTGIIDNDGCNGIERSIYSDCGIFSGKKFDIEVKEKDFCSLRRNEL